MLFQLDGWVAWLIPGTLLAFGLVVLVALAVSEWRRTRRP